MAAVGQRLERRLTAGRLTAVAVNSSWYDDGDLPAADLEGASGTASDQAHRPRRQPDAELPTVPVNLNGDEPHPRRSSLSAALRQLALAPAPVGERTA